MKNVKVGHKHEVLASEKVPTGMKLGYALGDFGANFQFQAVAIFLMYYFTDVFGITAATAGWIFLLSKFWDAISDPTMGYIADRTETRWGQKRPWLLFGAIPLGVTLFLLFAVPPITSYTWKVVYATATFLAVLTFYTVVNVPYSAMTANLTLDSRERGSLTGFRMMGALLGTLLVATLTKPLVACFSDEVVGFRSLGIIYGLGITICTLITFFIVKERVRTHVEAMPGGFKDIFKVVTSNKPLFYLFFGIFFHYTSFLVFLASVPYFFKYCMKKPEFLSIGFFCIYIPAIIMLPILVKSSSRWSKKIMFNGGMGVFAFGLICLYFVKEYNPVILVVVYIILGLGTAAIYQGPWSTIPDTVEYSEWKTGLRREGIIYGVFFFGMKLAAGFAAFMVGYILSRGGYNAGINQTETTLFTIRFLTTILPLICYVFGVIFVWLYPINHKFHKQIVDDIVAKM
jgi:glycoside/pentoside/hexuronide:cation symporter, GPH family